MEQFCLPQINISYNNRLPEKLVFLAVGGRKPNRRWLKDAVASFPVWCVDGGIEICKESGIIPKRLIGDGDSSTGEAWQWAVKNHIPIDEYPAKKNYTDLQLALKTLGNSFSPVSAVITGGWGGRFDHNFANLYSMIWAQEWGVNAWCLADDREILLLLKGPETISIEFASSPMAVSLLALSSVCQGVSIDSVYWPLHKTVLYSHQPYAISNRINSDYSKIGVSVDKGWLGVYFNWENDM